MWPLDVGDIVLITAVFRSLNVDTMFNTLYWRFEGPQAIANGNEALSDLMIFHGNDAIASTFATNWKEWASQDFTLDAIWGQKVYPTRFVRQVQDVAVPGGNAVQAMPGLVQATIVRRGLQAGKGKTGAIRVCGVREDAVEFGQLNAIAQTQLENLAQNITGSIALTQPSANWRAVIFDRASPGFSQPVESTEVKLNVRAQRSRINFRGI